MFCHTERGLVVGGGSGEPSGAFGKWALAACLEGTTHFASASQIARRHYKQGISDRQCVRAILYEHTKQKFASCDAVMRASGVPALDCSSSSLAYDVLMHMRLVSGRLSTPACSSTHLQQLLALCIWIRIEAALNANCRVMCCSYTNTDSYVLLASALLGL